MQVGEVTTTITIDALKRRIEKHFKPQALKLRKTTRKQLAELGVPYYTVTRDSFVADKIDNLESWARRHNLLKPFERLEG